MTHIITSLCLRDGACVEVCPVNCIVPGHPADAWPWYYIDPATCIDCGRCISKCPQEAIFIEDEVQPEHLMAIGQKRVDHVTKQEIEYTSATPDADMIVDLTDDIQPNYDFFYRGPGYDALHK
jgi:ferredoxin